MGDDTSNESTSPIDWQSVFHALGHPTLLIDADRTIVAANEAAQLLYVQNRVSLRGAKCSEVVCGGSEPPAGCPVEALFTSANVEPATVELEALGRNLQVVCSAVTDDQGRVTHVTHSAVDISDRKGVERSLQDAEANYQLLSENVNDWIFTTDLQLRWTYSSPSVAGLRGYTVEEALHQPMSEALTSRSWEVARTALAVELLKEQTEDPSVYQPYVMDLEFNRKDGTTVWTELKATFLRDEQGRPTGICGVARDITLRRAASAEREQLESQLHHAQRMEAVGRLAGGVAHDFNNMLSVMMGYTALLRSTADSTEQDEDLAEIDEAIGRAADLTRQLLTFSRRQISSPIVLSLNTVVEETERLLSRIVGEDIDLRTELADELAPVYADRSQLDQALANLALNARDAMPRGGRLTMRTANVVIDDAEARRVLDLEPGTYILLEVTDTGVGMPQSVLERVFEPFYSTKDDGKGTGLGLSTVYGIVKQAGGHVFVESAPREGTKFSLFFPQVAADVRPAAEPPPRPSGAPRSTTVLLVEDEAPLRRLVRRTLEAQGHQVLEAEQAEHALQVVEQHQGPIDVLLTDLILPGPSGRALAEQLTALRPELRVVYMSGHSDEIVADHGLLEEGIVFLPKPFGPQDLADKIGEALSS